jgi:hypothetical protein
MKILFFTAFLEMVEDKFGYEVMEDIISKSELPSNGSYIAVGIHSSH